MVYIVFPQAIRIIIPALGNSVNGLLKTTSITSVISMEELLRSTQILIQEKFLVLELFTVAALYYLLLTSIWDMIQRRIEARFSKPYRNIEITESRWEYWLIINSADSQIIYIFHYRLRDILWALIFLLTLINYSINRSCN